MEICQSWGIASARHSSGIAVCHHRHQFDVPLGPSIVRWCVRTNARVLQFRAHSDVITCMKFSPDKTRVVTTSHCGEVKLWSVTDSWRCLFTDQACMAQLHHLAWSPDSSNFLIVGNGLNSSLAMYALHDDRCSFNVLWVINCQVGYTKWNQASTTEDTPCFETFNMAEINLSNAVFALKEKSNGTVCINLYTSSGELRRDFLIQGKHATLLSSYSSIIGGYAIVLQGGTVITVDAENLDIKGKFNVGYASRSCVWDGKYIMLPSDSGRIIWWSMSGDKEFDVVVDVMGYVVHLEWSVDNSALWVCGIGRLSYVAVNRNTDGILSGSTIPWSIDLFNIACCGVSLSHRKGLVCTGDLGGAVWIFERTNSQPISKTKGWCKKDTDKIGIDSSLPLCFGFDAD